VSAVAAGMAAKVLKEIEKRFGVPCRETVLCRFVLKIYISSSKKGGLY
jgi:hypothetical protein